MIIVSCVKFIYSRVQQGGRNYKFCAATKTAAEEGSPVGRGRGVGFTSRSAHSRVRICFMLFYIVRY